MAIRKYQTSEGEAQRDDENFCHAAVWEYMGVGKEPVRHIEELKYENVKRTQGVTNNELNSTYLASKDENDKGKMVQYEVRDVSPGSSFLEMLDELNQEIIAKGEEPVIFDHDCREGICGSYSMVINGRPHDSKKNDNLSTTRSFNDGESVYIEPWRAKLFL